MPEPMSREPCERCGELGCDPAFHAEGTLIVSATFAALLGATLIGLVALPAWMRRLASSDEVPGHPRTRHAQDLRLSVLLSATLMATATIATTTAFGLALGDRDRSAWPGVAAPGDGEATDELGEILALIVEGGPEDASLGGAQLEAIAEHVAPEHVPRILRAHERVAAHPERARPLRAALRANGSAAASRALASLFDEIAETEERVTTLAVLGRCAEPGALASVIDQEVERYRTPLVASQIERSCVHHVAHDLLTLAREHPLERAPTYVALAEACDVNPGPLRDSVGAAIAETWLAAAAGDPPSLRSSDYPHLAHALACADEALLDRALETVPPESDEWLLAELTLVSFRRGRLDLDETLARAEEDWALRATLDQHYQGTAPWRDPVIEDAAARERP